MKDLPDEFRMKHMSKLVIPGSHHSMSFSIEEQSPVAGDYTKMELSGIWRIFTPFFSRRVLTRWSKVQSVNLTSQLCMGIRYFDFRLQYEETSGIILVVHLMKSEPLSDGLETINSFLHSHDKELVILDFQHFVGFTARVHSSLTHLLRVAFGDKLCPGDISMSKISLEAMHRRGYQVIVVYRKFCSHNDYFRGCFFPIVYSRAEHPAALKDSVIDRLSIPWPDKWFVIVYMILKPGRRLFGYKRFFKDARYYAKTALTHSTRELVEYLKSSAASPTIIVADFIDIEEAEFSKMIVALNYSEPTVLNRTMTSSPNPVRSNLPYSRKEQIKARTSDESKRNNSSL